MIILLLLAVPAAIPAETYQWTDAAGVKHFTDNPDTIPAKYLNHVRELPSAQPEQQGTAAPPPAVSVPPLSPSFPVEQGTLEARRANLGRELQKLQDGLPAKRMELDQLRRKWTKMKGRTPTPKEIAEFEQKKAKGPVSFADNPYLNKNPLGTPGRARETYFRKLDEVRQDEERIDRLRKELNDPSR
jgi:hypothetical protein